MDQQVYTMNDQLLISSVTDLLRDVGKLVGKSSVISIDLCKVSEIDSAGIAFLIELKSLAKQKNCRLIFLNVPSIVTRLCELYQVTI